MLLKRGYEVKAATFIPVSDVEVEMAQPQVRHGKLLITFQSGPSIAVCGFTVEEWSSLDVAAFEQTDRCHAH